MNDSIQPHEANGASAPSLGSGLSGDVLSEIVRALETVYNPRANQEVRLSATTYLDTFKADENLLQYGYVLADANQAVQVRFYGLTLLDHVIKHEWHHLDDNHSSQIRQYILSLGKNLTGSDPLYLRNKFAQLWVELSKRIWALDWFDLDEELIKLWQKDQNQEIFVLTVLEGLSEDVFIREDPRAVLRGTDLSSALVNIFTSSSEHTGLSKIGQHTYNIRSGDEGWLVRLNRLLTQCLNGNMASPGVGSLACKTLSTLRSVFAWLMTPAIANSGCLESVCNCLSTQDADVVMVGHPSCARTVLN